MLLNLADCPCQACCRRTCQVANSCCWSHLPATKLYREPGLRAICCSKPKPGMLSANWFQSCMATLPRSSHWTPILPVANVLGSVCIVQRAQCLLLALYRGSNGRDDAGLGAPAQGVTQQPRQLAVPAPGSSCIGRNDAFLEGLPRVLLMNSLSLNHAALAALKRTRWQWCSFWYICLGRAPADPSTHDRQHRSTPHGRTASLSPAVNNNNMRSRPAMLQCNMHLQCSLGP